MCVCRWEYTYNCYTLMMYDIVYIWIKLIKVGNKTTQSRFLFVLTYITWTLYTNYVQYVVL